MRNCKLEITDEGDITEYFGIEIQSKEEGIIKLSQTQLIKRSINDVGFNECTKTRSTPALLKRYSIPRFL